jgi:serine protease Do
MKPGIAHRPPTASRARATTRLARVVVASLTVFLLLPLSAGAQTTTTATPEEMAAAVVRPSIVYLDIYWSAYVQDHEGDWLNEGNPYEFAFSCTGFVVNPNGYIATAGHCVDDGLEGAAGVAILYGVDEWIANGWASEDQRADLTEIAYANWHVEGGGTDTPADRTVYAQHGVAVSGMTSGEAWPARVVEALPVSEGDVALLKVEETNLPTILLASDADVAIGTSILSVGYPASSDWVTDATYEPTYKDGKISSKKTREGGLLPVYEISAAVSPGMSGGPTVNTEGDVIGVNSFGILGEPQAFNFLSPSSLVLEMMSRNGVANELGPVDELYRTAITSFMAGNYRQAMDEFDEVLDRVPSHQQAQEYRALAAQRAPTDAPETEEPVVEPTEPAEPAASSMPTMAIAIVGLVLLVAIGLGAFFMMRRRGGTPTAGGPPPAVPMPPPTVLPPPPMMAAEEHADEQHDVVPDAPHFCEECGALMSPTAKFCGACGAHVAHPVES